jgi:hypothetical protein
MRQSFKRAGLTVATVLLALAGVMAAAGPASAARLPTDMSQSTPVRACPFPAGCAVDAISVQGRVASFCFSDVFDLVYSGPVTGRGGYVGRSLLNPDNPQSCTVAGTPVTVSFNSNLGSCSGGGCVNFGAVNAGDQANAFCHLPPGDATRFLVYMRGTTRAGFLPRSAFRNPPVVSSCNQGF